MALVGISGTKRAFIGPNIWITNPSSQSGANLDAANEAYIAIGYIETSDGNSHTIDTSGSSSLFWRTGSVTFANASTTVKVGIAAVTTTAGPPGRAANVADVITFDVSKTLIGGGGGITSTAAQNHVPDTGSKTIANGDLVAFCVQMTARGGTDIVTCLTINAAQLHLPQVTGYIGATYTVFNALPNAFITFSDGATGWFYGGEVFSTAVVRTWNSSSSPNEYGQLYTLPFPSKIYGLYCWISPSAATANFDLVLYSTPLGTPVAQKTVSTDSNTIGAVAARRHEVFFASPYTATASEQLVAAVKPGATDCGAFYKTFASAGHRVSDPWGTSGYGVSRSSGAFANANSSLDHYYIGLIGGAFDEGAGGAGGGGRVARVNNDSVVA